ncbi:hypothetical protein K1T71_007457 [Dendrolimus kikuchii]|uniref:Uncharacterized protein n=1 Tax=Dendrolimus kikuchii TaxID=765133 RepID=A0ACC1D1K0_9NEOP|nr:hypothetical protein K1T71_007457 [Dendrolimus kikuchii]
MLLLILKQTYADYEDDLEKLDESKCDFNKSFNLDVGDIEVQFIDYDNVVTLTEKIYDIADNITNYNNLDVTKRLIVYVHGLFRDESDMSIQWNNNVFKNVPNIYLMTINYSTYTKNLKIAEMGKAVTLSFYIGEAIGQLLSILNSIGFESNNIHCVGFCLGAHIIGYAAKIYKEITLEKISKLTGIDPSGFCFENQPMEQIRSGLADYVEVYHCVAGVIATTNDVADTDIYFNPSFFVQPGCDVKDEGKDSGVCSHVMCLMFWLKSVQNENLYQACVLDAVYNGKCNNTTALAGYSNPGNVTGLLMAFTDK